MPQEINERYGYVFVNNIRNLIFKGDLIGLIQTSSPPEQRTSGDNFYWTVEIPAPQIKDVLVLKEERVGCSISSETRYVIFWKHLDYVLARGNYIFTREFCWGEFHEGDWTKLVTSYGEKLQRALDQKEKEDFLKRQQVEEQKFKPDPSQFKY